MGILTHHRADHGIVKEIVATWGVCEGETDTQGGVWCRVEDNLLLLHVHTKVPQDRGKLYLKEASSRGAGGH